MPIPYYEEIELRKSIHVRKKAFDYTFTPTKFEVYIKPNPNYLRPKKSVATIDGHIIDEENIEELKKIILLPNETNPIEEIMKPRPHEKCYTTIIDTAPKIIPNLKNVFTGVVSSYILPNGELYQQIGDHHEGNILNDLRWCERIISEERLKKCKNPFEDGAFIRSNKPPIVEIERLKHSNESELSHVLKDEINQFDVGSFINGVTYNHLEYYKNEYDEKLYYYHGEGDYSDELKQLIINLKKAKTYIYNYYYQLCLNIKDPEIIKEALEDLNTKYEFDHDVTKLVSMIGIDKIEKTRIGTYTPLDSLTSYNEKNPNYLIIRNQIRTSRTNIYESYFNYFLRGYNIIRLPKIVFNKNRFDIIPIEETIEIGSEREYKKELDEIMTKVKPEHRHLYSLK